jgi:signal transduction histidine kinase
MECHLKYQKMKTMKIVYVLLLLATSKTPGQAIEADSLRNLLKQPYADTTQLMLQVQLYHTYLFSQPDSAIIFSRQAIVQAKKLHFYKAEVRALNVLGQALRLTGDIPQAMETHFQALQISRTHNDQEEEAANLDQIGAVYMQLNEYQQGLFYFRQSLLIETRAPRMTILILSAIGDVYEKMNRMDSAMIFQQQAYSLLPGIRKGTLHSLVMLRMGIIEARLKNTGKSLQYYREALANAVLTGDMLNRGRVQYQVADLYYQVHQQDSSIAYARMAYQTSQQLSHKLTLLAVSNLLVKLFQGSPHVDSALYYQQVAMAVNDNLFGPAKYKRLQLLALSEQQRRQQLLDDQRLSKERYQKITWFSSLAVVLLIATLLWRNNHQQKAANRSLNQKNTHIEQQRNLLQAALADLEDAQTEIIEKEKVAALYRQQLQIHQVRNKIASELHDDIGSTLSSINLFSEVARKQISKDGSQAMPMLEKIKTSSQEMMLAMNEIVWSIQSKNDEVEKLVEKIHSFASQLLAARNIIFRFDYPGQLQVVPLAMETRRNIYLICKETFNNITRHSRATEVAIAIKLEKKGIRIEIQDNGCGFDSGQPSAGNGLPNLYQRAVEIGAQLHIDSRTGHGTRVYLECPLA